MASSLQFVPPATRVRRALGRLRRSSPLRHAAGFLAIQSLRARQRLRARFVRGVWLHTRDYLANAPRGAAGFLHAPAAPAGRTIVGAPTFAGASPRHSTDGPIGLSYEACSVAQLARPWVVGGAGAVIGRDRQLLWDLSYEWPGQPHHHTTYRLVEVHATAVPGCTATLAAMAADRNYFHFLLNSVARLVYLERTPNVEPPDCYLVSGSVNSFVADTFALFGIPRASLIGTDEHEAIRPELLLAPPLVRDPFIVPAHVCEFLHDTVLAALPKRRRMRRRIFIDRSDAGTRRIANLAALQPLLDAFAIEPVRLSGLSVGEQAALFNDAELVIGNHGAALSNLVFCEPGTRVLQVLAPGMMEREYRTLSQHARLRHDYLVADFATPDDAHLARKHRDLVLPPDFLRRVLEAENDAVPTVQLATP